MPLEAEIGGTWDRPVEQWEELVMRDPIYAELSKRTPSKQQGSQLARRGRLVRRS